MKKYKVKKGFITQKIGNKTVIFDGEESMLYTFNSTGGLIFEKLKHGLGEGEIADFLMNKHSISKAEAARDVSSFLNELKDKKIIY